MSKPGDAIHLKRISTKIVSDFPGHIKEIPPSVQPLIIATGVEAIMKATGPRYEKFIKNPVRAVSAYKTEINKTCCNMVKAFREMSDKYDNIISDEKADILFRNGAMIRKAGIDLALVTLVASIGKFSLPPVKDLWKLCPVLPGGRIDYVQEFTEKYKTRAGINFIAGQENINEIKDMFLRPGFVK